MHNAAFLGPKAENADLLESLLTEVLRDHVFWRRNFHASDPRLITEQVKRSEAYERADAAGPRRVLRRPPLQPEQRRG